MRERRERKQKFFQVKKVCEFCKNKEKEIDYKNIKVLQKFINFYAKIESKKRSGCCSKHQRIVEREIKRARMVALLPFTSR